MPFNGSGSFSVYTPGNPAVTGTSISSTAFNNTMNDFATGLSNTITRDGQSPATANIPMGGNKLTGVGSGTARTDALPVGQFQDGGPVYLTGVAGVDTITASLSPAITTYAAGQTFRFVSAGANTGAATININGLGAKAITKSGATALSAADIASGAAVQVVYDGTQFQLTGAGAGGTDYLNTTRIDVASAATVNLTSSAPNTRNINITGTTTITAVTVAIGQLYFVRFNAALTLTNNANIVTQTGANITTAAGDTCILRATAANTVEVLSYGYVTVPLASLPSITPAKLSQPFTSGTAVATTSGTSIDFTGIPSWVKRITLMLNGVSTNGASNYLVQIGSGSIDTATYISGCAYSTTAVTSTNGFTVANGVGASDICSGSIVLTHLGSNVWTQSGVVSSNVVRSSSGSKTLSGALDRIRLTSVTPDTFDAGSVNILYE